MQKVVVNLLSGKIGKIGATSCQSLRPKCTKCDFRWGSQTTLGELSASPGIIAAFKAAYSNGRGRGGCGGEGKGKVRGGREGSEGP